MFTCVGWQVIPYGKWRLVALRWLVQESYISFELLSHASVEVYYCHNCFTVAFHDCLWNVNVELHSFYINKCVWVLFSLVHVRLTLILVYADKLAGISDCYWVECRQCHCDILQHRLLNGLKQPTSCWCVSWPMGYTTWWAFWTLTNVNLYNGAFRFCKVVIMHLNSLKFIETRKPCYRKDDCAMRPIFISYSP